MRLPEEDRIVYGKKADEYVRINSLFQFIYIYAIFRTIFHIPDICPSYTCIFLIPIISLTVSLPYMKLLRYGYIHNITITLPSKFSPLQYLTSNSLTLPNNISLALLRIQYLSPIMPPFQMLNAFLFHPGMLKTLTAQCGIVVDDDITSSVLFKRSVCFTVCTLLTNLQEVVAISSLHMWL